MSLLDLEYDILLNSEDKLFTFENSVNCYCTLDKKPTMKMMMEYYPKIDLGQISP